MHGAWSSTHESSAHYTVMNLAYETQYSVQHTYHTTNTHLFANEPMHRGIPPMHM